MRPYRYADKDIHLANKLITALGGGAYQFLCIFGDFLWSLDIQTVGLARGFTIVLCIHRRSNIATSNHSTVYTSL